jgi:hypothetical protein
VGPSRQQKKKDKGKGEGNMHVVLLLHCLAVWRARLARPVGRIIFFCFFSSPYLFSIICFTASI